MYEEEDILGAPAQLVRPRGRIVEQLYAFHAVAYRDHHQNHLPSEDGMTGAGLGVFVESILDDNAYRESPGVLE